MDDKEPNYWTQYKRTHDYLGTKRGPGLPKEYPDRPSYNLFTGILYELLNCIQIIQIEKVNETKNQIGQQTKITNAYQPMF